MITNLPVWINGLFLITTLVTILFFHLSNGKPTKTTCLILVWAILHSPLAYSGFYQDTTAFPPPFGLILIPVFLVIICSLLFNRDNIIANRNTQLSTFLHTVRIPVELVLLQLYLHEMVPELMTFEGRNFDILIGISAPLIGMLLLKNRISKKALLIWNIIGLCFVTFILINGLLSAELPIQQFAFDQPNRAVTFFPFILLPAVVVPIVIWTHTVDILKLIKH